jgi:hypothetical protein
MCIYIYIGIYICIYILMYTHSSLFYLQHWLPVVGDTEGADVCILIRLYKYIMYIDTCLDTCLLSI